MNDELDGNVKYSGKQSINVYFCKGLYRLAVVVLGKSVNGFANRIGQSHSRIPARASAAIFFTWLSYAYQKFDVHPLL